VFFVYSCIFKCLLYFFVIYAASLHIIKHNVCSNKHLLFGMDNGCVRIQPIHNNDPGLMGPYWSLPMHDNDCGAVTQLSSSFDDKFIFSVGCDGNFFVFAIIDEKRVEQEAAQSKLRVPSAKVFFAYSVVSFETLHITYFVREFIHCSSSMLDCNCG